MFGYLLEVRLSKWTLYEGLHSCKLFNQSEDSYWHAILGLLEHIFNSNSVCAQTGAFTHHVQHL